MPTASARRRQAPERARPTDLHVYDGRRCIGLLRPRGAKVAAYAVSNTFSTKLVGTYSDMRAAMCAIPNNMEIITNNKTRAAMNRAGLSISKGRTRPTMAD